MTVVTKEEWGVVNSGTGGSHCLKWVRQKWNRLGIEWWQSHPLDEVIKGLDAEMAGLGFP